MTPEVSEEMVERVARAMADKMKAAADSVNSTAWISGPDAGYGGPHEEMVTSVAMTLDGEFDLCVLARAALSAALPLPVEGVGAVLKGNGWVFWNPDSGEEYSPNHPVESGECDDAEHIRKATGQEDALWAGMQEQFKRANALASPSAEAAQPVAWQFELAMAHDTQLGYCQWGLPQLSFTKPVVPGGSVRNVIPLYALPPQWELREALDRLKAIRGKLATVLVEDRSWHEKHNIVDEAVAAIDAALAGRTAG